MSFTYDGYKDWLNEILFEHKGEEDGMIWLGDNRWAIYPYDAPGEMFIIEISPAKVVKADEKRNVTLDA